MFNPEAWSDTDFMLEWIKHMHCTLLPPNHTWWHYWLCPGLARIEELADYYIDQNEREWVEGKYKVS